MSLREWWEETDRVTQLLIVAVLLIGGVTVAQAATTFTTTDGVTFESDNGFRVVTSEYAIDTDNPFVDSNTVELRNTTLRGASGEVKLDGTTSEFSNVTVRETGVNYEISRDDMSRDVVVRNVDQIRVRDLNISRDASRTDFVVQSGGSGTVRLEGNLPNDGGQLLFVNADTGNLIASTTISNGQAEVTVDGLSSPTPVNVRKARQALAIRFAQQPDTLVDGEELRVRFFPQSGEIIERKTTDGTVPLTGLPRGEQIAVTVNSTTNTTFRRNVILSLFEQQAVFVLDKNTDTTAITFNVNDRTGRFGGNSRLVVERPLARDFDGDGSDETRYVTVVAGELGAGNFETLLVPNERYRLKVINGDGETREIGSYVPRQSETVDITLGQVIVPVENRSQAVIGFTTTQEDLDDDGSVEQVGRVEFVDQDKRTERLTFSIQTRDNVTVVDEQTVSGPVGVYVKTFELNSSTTNTTYVLEYEFEREQLDGTDVVRSGQKFAGDVPALLANAPIDERWLELLGYVAIIAAGGLVLVLDASLGALAATLMAGLLTMLGVVAVPAPALGLAGAVSVLSIFGRFR